ncbi:MAG: hypothetical protein IT292_00815 [Deltaproteobacteria bacterium]|nr:hypothetical protein [Deltaproteobacteria bacterium]
MMRAMVRISQLIIILMFALSFLPAYAQIAVSNKLPEDVYLISDIEEIPFEVQTSKMVVWQPEQGVSVYPALSDPLGKGAGMQYFIGGPVNLENQAQKSELYYSFLLSDAQGNFFATPVSIIALKDLFSQEKEFSELETQNAGLINKINDTEQKMAKLETRAIELRNMISEIVGVNRLIKLRKEAAALQARNAGLQAHQEYLQSLQERAKAVPELEDIDILRKELNANLQATAEATALADRLVKRRKHTAMLELQNKLSAVRETANDDPKALAKQALELRSERKRLEMKLGKSLPAQAEEF